MEHCMTGNSGSDDEEFYDAKDDPPESEFVTVSAKGHR